MSIPSNKVDVSVDTLYINGASWPWGMELGDGSESYRNLHSFSGLLSSHYNLKLFNAAFPGASNQRILRTTVFDISKLKEKGQNPFVIIVWGLTHRFELYNNKKKDWVSFINPETADNLQLAKTIWENYSSDYSDDIQFVMQVILMESFLKKNNVPYFMVNVHDFNPELVFSKDDIELFKTQVDSKYYISDLSLSKLVKSYPNLKWGIDHPLEDGHKFVADFLKTNIDHRYIINKG